MMATAVWHFLVQYPTYLPPAGAVAGIACLLYLGSRRISYRLSRLRNGSE